MVEFFLKGTCRSIYVYGSCEDFLDWAAKSNRPPMPRLREAIVWVADRTIEELMLGKKIWLPVQGSEPKLYEIRKDQARVYCCFCKKGIVMLDWDIKKQRKASKAVLARAVRRAEEVLENERTG